MRRLLLPFVMVAEIITLIVAFVLYAVYRPWYYPLAEWAIEFYPDYEWYRGE